MMLDQGQIRSTDGGEVYEFDDFRLDVPERCLESTKTGGRVPLPDKAFDTLCVLVRNSGRLVKKEELLSTVWADSFVEENNLNKSIHAIRRALGETNGEQTFIETIKKHGFRFVADVRSVPRRASAVSDSEVQNGDRKSQTGLVREFPHLVPRAEPLSDGALALAIASRPIPAERPDSAVDKQFQKAPELRSANVRRRRGLFHPVIAGCLLFAMAAAGLVTYRYTRVPNEPALESLAVLPLKPMDASDNYLGLGMADAIIRRMSQTATVTVRPTSAVRRYLNEETDALTAARQLGVDAVLEGTVQRAADRLRVTVNLLRTSDGKSLWTENFDMTSSDVFSIQDKVSQQVASSLRLRLDPAQRERLANRHIPNAIAYEYYLKGIYSFDQRGYSIDSKPQHEATISLLQRSIEADPDFAPAHAHLAYAYAWMAVYIDEKAQAEWVSRAKEEIERANALDPQLAETHIAHHHVLLSANEGFQLEAATHEALLAREINPNIGIVDLAADFLHLGLEDLFEPEVQRALATDPTSEFNKNLIGILYLNAGRYDDWLAHREKYFDGKPNLEYLLGVGRLDEAEQLIGKTDLETPVVSEHGLRTMLLALRGDHASAEAEIPALISELPFKRRGYHHATYNIACIYALGGNSAEAVRWLRETAKSGFPEYLLFEREHYLDPIRQSPEFVQFMTEMKAEHERLEREFAR
ncbi:MAG TPA: winged helix-turn-helix domain-containing protein [Pyrinomonadaceae bacterium]|nr:winged helix-turn-helix domain-containing protein [Pyrinomonadaceae bacterium]